MKPAASTDQNGLIFDWRSHRDTPNLVLPAFFLLSILLHAASFYLFQIVYPPTVLLRPPAAHLQILDPDSTENWRIALWLEGEDPSLVALHAQNNSELTSRTAPLAYTPTYASTSPSPISPTLETGKCELPPALIAGPVRLSAAPSTAPAGGSTTLTEEIPTALHLSSELAARYHAPLPAIPPLAPLPRGLQSPRFSVAVAANGRVQHVFCERSSGNPVADLHLTAYLKGLTFPASATPTQQWGTASIYWGNASQAPTANQP